MCDYVWLCQIQLASLHSGPLSPIQAIVGSDRGQNHLSYILLFDIIYFFLQRYLKDYLIRITRIKDYLKDIILLEILLVTDFLTIFVEQDIFCQIVLIHVLDTCILSQRRKWHGVRWLFLLQIGVGVVRVTWSSLPRMDDWEDFNVCEESVDANIVK